MIRCLAALELGLPPEPTGGNGLGSDVDASFSLPRFFFSGKRSGALARRATPVGKQNHQCSLLQTFIATFISLPSFITTDKSYLCEHV